MGLLQAISGLNAANTLINVISDNISNAHTIGFKSNNVIFSDLESKINQTNKIEGMGVNILKKTSSTNSGEIFYTNRNLDLSINKNGFFRLSKKNGSTYYTRNGNFHINKNRCIVNSIGMYLTGYLIKDPHLNFTKYNSQLLPMDLSSYNKTNAQPTTILKLFVNLNSHDHIKINSKFDKDIHNTYNCKLKTKIIDHLGKEKFINFYFIKTADKTWHIHPFETSKNNKIKPFKIEFDSNGYIISNKIIDLNLKSNSNKKEENISLNLEKILQKKITDNKNYFSQNGYKEGIIENYEINNNGTIYGIYSNQKKIPLSKIVLSNFSNAENLKSEGNSIWSKTDDSGIEIITSPDGLESGKIISGGLEKSNVDLNKEFIDMITAQRNYQSNAQVIKAEEKIFNTLINL